MSSTLMFDVATELLSYAAQVLVCDDNSPPDRQFVGICQPPADCEMLTVYASEVGDLLVADNDCARVPGPTFVIDLWRCICDRAGDNIIPTVDENQAAALQQMKDGWLLFKGLEPDKIMNHFASVIDDFCPCLEVARSSIECLPASGCFAGWRMSVRMQLSGEGCE